MICSNNIKGAHLVLEDNVTSAGTCYQIGSQCNCVSHPERIFYHRLTLSHSQVPLLMDNNKGRIKTKCKELTKYLDEHINIYIAKFRSFLDDDIDKRNLEA